MAPVVTITSITLSSNKIQNRDVLAPTNPDPSEKMVVIIERELSASREAQM